MRPSLRLLFVSLCLWSPLAAADPCLPDRFDEAVEVERFYDGDTVRLGDGRRVRFIGIDTPEIFHARDEAEPYAHEALEALIALVDGGRIRIIRDRERLDRYGRTLAHAFTDDEPPVNITTSLLAGGLGIALTIPPNDRFVDCYRAAEAEAREAGEGLWSLPEREPVEGTELPAKAEGFHVVLGEVVRTGSSRSSLWINLDGGLALRIARDDLQWFADDFDHTALEGKRVTVRGWIYRHRDQPRIRIRHPVDLDVEEQG